MVHLLQVGGNFVRSECVTAPSTKIPVYSDVTVWCGIPADQTVRHYCTEYCTITSLVFILFIIVSRFHQDAQVGTMFVYFQLHHIYENFASLISELCSGKHSGVLMSDPALGWLQNKEVLSLKCFEVTREV